MRIAGGLDFEWPRFVRVQQNFPHRGLTEIPRHVQAAVAKAVGGKLQGRVAVAVGSRGIASLPEIIAALVAELKAGGAEPFIVPAMGSHGGATAAGQATVLAELGITEEGVGAPVYASMETVVIGRLPSGVPVHVDRLAVEADGIVVVNRVKPHTDFRAPVESGLMKLMVIGLGNHEGATAIHADGPDRLGENIVNAGSLILRQLPVLFGLAVVEDAHERPALIEAIPRGEIPRREPELLRLASEWMARILLPEFDFLIVDEIGKEISGDGMDPNVTGRYAVSTMTGGPRIQKVLVLDLTNASHGNACGVGLADLTTRRLVRKIDWEQTYINALTATILGGVKLPVVLETDREAIAVGLKILNRTTPTAARVVRIKNTRELTQVDLSEALWAEMQGSKEFTLLDGPSPLRFDERGTLAAFAGGPSGSAAW